VPVQLILKMNQWKAENLLFLVFGLFSVVDF
jgi:hypothetical protein